MEDAGNCSNYQLRQLVVSPAPQLSSSSSASQGRSSILIDSSALLVILALAAINMRWFALVAVASTAFRVDASTLTPPVLPLFVRTPYLSAWLANARAEPWTHWPEFWTGQVLGMSVLAAVPDSDTVYPLLGPGQASLKKHDKSYNVSYPKYDGVTFDASTTNLTYRIPSPSRHGSSLEIVLSFLSPITPTSTLRQSIPAAYLTVHVKGSFNIDFYIDFSGEWVSGFLGNGVEWTYDDEVLPHGKSEKALKTFKMRRAKELVFSEIDDRAEWGTMHFTGPHDVDHESGSADKLRQQFANTGKLANKMDKNFRAIKDGWPVVAFSKSFKLNDTTSTKGFIDDSILFTIAHTQNPIVQYASARGLTQMRPLWASWFKDEKSLIQYHYFDFPTAKALAGNYSDQLAIDALNSGSEDYKDIVALSARQVLGATSFSGTPDNPILFLKEISSNGDFQTVDVIYPAFPFFLYTNPKWLAYLMEPLLEHLLSGQYPRKYVMHDMGVFPNATGHSDGNDEYMPVEECGNFLVMGLALVNAMRYGSEPASIWTALGADIPINDATTAAFPLTIDINGMDDKWGGSVDGKGLKQAQKWLRPSYHLWKQWTAYLVDKGLIPENQLSTDDFAGPIANHTNLALKGIIGIRAMSELAIVMGEHEDARYYRNISDVYIKKWEEYAISDDATGRHAKLAYTWNGSWTTLYNLYTDALLCFHVPIENKNLVGSPPKDQKPILEDRDSKTGFVPQSIYKLQSELYHDVRQKYGLPLDSRHLYTKSDWEFFAIAVARRSVREEIIQSIALWVSETSTDLYETEGTGGFGAGNQFKARPVVGGHFSFLALERACDGKAIAGLRFLEEDEAEHTQEENRNLEL